MAGPLPSACVRPAWWDETISIAAGAAFTAGLLVAMARMATVAPPPAPAVDEDLRVVAMPPEAPPPPPPVTETAPAETTDAAFTGLEVGASDSAVKIAVVPPDLDAIVPRRDEMPKARIDVGRLYSEFRPKAGFAPDPQRVYQPSEVDQKPSRLVTTSPVIPARVRGDATALTVRLLIVVNEKGEATNVRVAQSSGNAQFDAIIIRCVEQEWGFTPAIRKGKRVKCLTEQPYTVRWSSGSPFRI